MHAGELKGVHRRRAAQVHDGRETTRRERAGKQGALSHPRAARDARMRPAAHPATSALIDLVCPVPRRARLPCGDDAVRRRLREQEDLQPLRAAREPRAQHGRLSEPIRPRRTESLFQPSDSKMVGLGWPPNRTRRRAAPGLGGNSRGSGRYQRWAHLRGVWEFLANVWQHTRCSLEYIEGVVRLSARPRASRGYACARAEFASCAAGSRHTTAAHPCRQRCCLAHHGESNQRQRRDDDDLDQDPTKLSVDDLHTRNARAGRDGNSLPWRASSPAPAPSASRLLLLGASR